MFLQIDQCEHYTQAKADTERDACLASCAYAVVWNIACCGINPRAVVEHVWFVIVKNEVAF